MAFGDSMLPTIGRWEHVKIIPIKNCRYKDVRIGEIVCYHSEGFNREGEHHWWHRADVIHRIVGKTKKLALIKGDNRDYIEKVPYDKIIGRVKLLKNRTTKGDLNG
jgi:hypothetical protein